MLILFRSVDTVSDSDRTTSGINTSSGRNGESTDYLLKIKAKKRQRVEQSVLNLVLILVFNFLDRHWQRLYISFSLFHFFTVLGKKLFLHACLAKFSFKSMISIKFSVWCV